MGAPLAVAAVARTRLGRRLALGALAAIALLVAFAVTPLVAIPLAVAGQSVSTVVSEGGGPQVVGEWGYPLAGSYFKGRGYGYHPVQGCAYCPKQHYGYDMSRGCGADIFAAGPGEATLAGAFGEFGNAVMIDHGGGISTLYGHMATGSLSVHDGDPVTAGTRLGAEGDTGLSHGCHLHFEVRRDGARIDPQPFMAALGLPLT